MAPFEVTLSEFYHSKNSKYLMLRCDNVPGPAEQKKKKKEKKKVSTEINQMVRLRRELEKLWKTEREEDYTPHSTVGQIAQQEIDQKMNELQKDWEPLRFRVESLTVLRKKKEKMIKIKEIPLSGT